MVVLQNPDQIWLFPDSLAANESLLATYIGDEVIKSKDGKTDIPVLIFATDKSERTLVNQWKIKTDKAVKVHGKDTKAWENKNFYLSASGLKIEIRPLEEMPEC